MKEFDVIRKLKILSNENSCAMNFLDDVAKIGDSIISTDTTIEGVHILPNLDPKFLAYKALARGVSDILAKNGEIIGYFMNLILPRGFDKIENIIEGLQAFAIDLLGGDTSYHDGKLIIVITVVGKSKENYGRFNAKTGDGIFITKKIGSAYLGYLDCLNNKFDTKNALEYLMPSLVSIKDWSGINASMDVSDGLLVDAKKMANASGLCFEIDFSLLPFANNENYQAMLSFGDDYNILLTSSKNVENAIQIGKVLQGNGLNLINFPFEIDFNTEIYGFEHG